MLNELIKSIYFGVISRFGVSVPGMSRSRVAGLDKEIREDSV